MTSLEQLRDEIAGILARNNVNYPRDEVTDNEVIIWYIPGEIDPSLIVQIIERETNGTYVGEKKDDTEEVGLKFELDES